MFLRLSGPFLGSKRDLSLKSIFSQDLQEMNSFSLANLRLKLPSVLSNVDDEGHFKDYALRLQAVSLGTS